LVNNQSRLNKFTTLLIYVVIGIATSILFEYLTELYVELFGETYTPMTKLVASTVSMLACLLIVFITNLFSLKLSSIRLGVALSLVMFAWLYIIGPGVRAPVTLYITAVSFPYNINMLATVLMPLILGRAFAAIVSKRVIKTLP
jgi:hypothetical protein